ncbi:MAG: hypothetical protein O3A27_05700 [Actinomycetota bacterium]|nr:hypothetical protein [Actinomycetota bacterium]
MAKPKERKDVYLRGRFTDSVQGAKPIKFKGYVLPEYFTCTVYLFDSDGKQVTKANAERFKVWSVELLIRVTAPETLETITTTIKGSHSFKGHDSMKFINTSLTSVSLENLRELTKLQKVKPSYYKAVADNRARLMGWAITEAVQSFIYKKQKDGTHFWPPFSNVKVSEDELQLLATGAIDNAYIRHNDTFLKDIARLYKKAIADGERPNEVIKQTYKRPDESEPSTKTVQAWTRKAYEKQFLTDKDKGKVSTGRKPVRKATRKKG